MVLLEQGECVSGEQECDEVVRSWGSWSIAGMCLWNDLGKIHRSWNLRRKLPRIERWELSASSPLPETWCWGGSRLTQHRLLRPALEWP